MIQLSDHFKSDSQSRHSEWLQQQRWFIKARHEKIRKDEEADKLDDLAGVASIIIAVTEAEFRRFEEKLDQYAEATVAALMENQEALDKVNEQLMLMLDQAYVMEDGRRVFKSEDGSYVIDEHGERVSPDEVDFDAIDNRKITAEDYRAQLDEEDRLQQERQELLDYQDKLDDARENIKNGDLSKQELDDLDAELNAAMPQSVRKKISGFDAAENAPDMKQEFAGVAPKEITSDPTSQLQASYNPMLGQ